jgi:hypothetical protein
MGNVGCGGGGVRGVLPMSDRAEFTLIAVLMLVVVAGWLAGYRS